VDTRAPIAGIGLGDLKDALKPIADKLTGGARNVGLKSAVLI
jgi:hypothetical protein